MGLVLTNYGALFKRTDTLLFGSAKQQVILPPHIYHIPWIGQGGGILLLHYSMILLFAELKKKIGDRQFD